MMAEKEKNYATYRSVFDPMGLEFGEGVRFSVDCI